jgi:hypothetical protein
MAKAVPRQPEPTFGELLQAHTLKAPQNLEEEITKTLDGLGKLTRRGYMHQNDAEYWTSISMLVERYFCYRLAQKLEPLNGSLFNLKRHATATVAYNARGTILKHDHTIELPLFASVFIEEPQWTWDRKVSHTFEGYNTAEAEIKFRVPAPYIPEPTREKLLHAGAYVNEVLAQSLKEKTLGELLMFSKQEFKKPTHDFRTIWIPRDEDLQIKFAVTREPDRDPAAILCYQSSNFIVDKWNISAEKPCDRILQEYAGIQNLEPFKHELKLQG